jgi:hypothetical protein
MTNIIPSLKYAWLTTVHKWFVFRAGLKVGVSLWQLLVHDLSKYTPAELPHYGRQFYGDKSDPVGFNIAWLHHQNVNPHHWEYWVPRTTHYAGTLVPYQPMKMPIKYAKEMAADWMGASRAYEGSWPVSFEQWNWFQANFYSLDLHPKTRVDLYRILSKAGVDASPH